MTNLVSTWLHMGTFILTNGPPDPISRPRNMVIPMPNAIYQQRRLMEVSGPVHLWRYPLAFQVQLWRGGWDVRVPADALVTKGGFHQRDRRTQLLYLLQDMIASLHPVFFIGPAHRPPVNVSHALREYERWPIVFIGGKLHRDYHWESVLHRKGAEVRRIDGGLWVELPKPS